MNITIRQIEAFLKVAEFGSFTRAAERLHVAQPALSQYVRDLESELGIRLFDRTTRRVELTEGGREFRNTAAKVVEDLELAARHAHELATRKRGKVAIATPPLLAGAILPWAIADFREQFPGVQVSVVEARMDEIVEQVRSGQVDCGLGTFRAGEAGIVSTAVTNDSLALFCPPPHVFAKRAHMSWHELDGQALVTLTRDSGIRLLVELGCETAQIGMSIAYEVSHVTTALSMVEAGLGVGVLPNYAKVAARRGAVATVPLVNPTITRDIVLITQAGRSVSPALSSFARVLTKRTVAKFPPSQRMASDGTVASI
jgi:DNA-binding transcriptional LysR family regulator